MDHDIDIHPRHKVILLLVIAVLCLVAFGVIATATSLPKLNWALVLFLFGLLCYALMSSGIRRAEQAAQGAEDRSGPGKRDRVTSILKGAASLGGVLALGGGLWLLSVGDATTGWISSGVGVATILTRVGLWKTWSALKDRKTK